MTAAEGINEKADRVGSMLERLEPTLSTIEKLQESGIIAMVEAFADEFDNIFNFATKVEIFNAATLVIKLLRRFSNFANSDDIDRLMAILEKVDVGKLAQIIEVALPCLTEADEALKPYSENREKLGVKEIVNELRSPEMRIIISVAKKLSNCVMEKSSKP
ncbi:MAG: hypothetical protein QW812_02085 [Thermoplasmataceae archaeon]